MAKRKRAALLPTNIALLQNLIRRDPPSYKEEFLLQYRHYESLRDIFLQNPDSEQGAEEFAELIGFVSQMCTCFPEDTKTFPPTLFSILGQHHHELPSELREKIVQSLSMLRNKDIITSDELIRNFFPILVSTDSKTLRAQIYSCIITLLKSVNQTAKNQKINKSVQALLFNLLTDAEANGLWATKITRELWRRGIWDDSRTVEIMTQAAVHSNQKVAISAARFFLGADKDREDAQQDDEDEDDSVDMASLRHKMQINKKSSKRGKKLETAVKHLKKKNAAHHGTTYLNFSAIHLLRDPQGFAENLFSTHLSRGGNKLSLEQKIIFTNLVSRLVGVHKLTVLGLYSFFLKYLTPKQRDVTQIMAAAAQASHDLVPPDVISPVVRKIADEFVSDGVAAEVAAAGINTIREIVSRAPLAIEKSLIQDLVEYKGSKAKPVVTAARSLVTLYREIDPSMLKTRDRGKIASMEMQSGEKTEGPKFGVESTAINGIQGLDLLMKWRAEQGIEGDDNNLEDGWEVASDEESEESSDDGEWVTVESDQEYEISDSEDEKDNEDKTDASKDSAAAKMSADTEAFMKLASTTVLTPADFAKMEELKVAAGVDKLMGRKKATQRNEEAVDAATLVGPIKYKQLREERIAAAKEGKEDRHFGSKKGKLQDKQHSTTNREKARKKNFIMMIHKRDVQGKAKKSLRDKQKTLQAHITKQKKKGF